MTPDNVYNEQEILKRLQHELPAWRHADGRLRRVYKMADWNAAIELVNRISPLAETAGFRSACRRILPEVSRTRILIWPIVSSSFSAPFPNRNQRVLPAKRTVLDKPGALVET